MNLINSTVTNMVTDTTVIRKNIPTIFNSVVIRKTLFVGAMFCLSFTLAADPRGLQRNTVNSSGTAFSDGIYRAIIIGNNHYQDPKNIWKPLSTAVEDAQSIAALLKESYGFTDIELITNANRREILQALSRMRKKTKENDSVLVYYAGHGWRNEVTREAYWIPVDAEGSDDSTFVSNARIKQKLSVIAEVANHTLLISDSCFSGTLLSSDRGAVMEYERDHESYFRKIARRKSVQILAAGGTEFVDDDYRSSGHSPFTYFLLKELSDNDNKYLSFSNLAIKVEQLVARNVDQTPQFGAFRKAGDEGGQFIFKRSNGVDNVAKGPATSRLFSRPKSVNSSDENLLPKGDNRSLVMPLPNF